MAPSKRDRAIRLIERANEKVDLIQVLAEFGGVEVPETFPKSWKTFCPWSEEHEDPHEKALRVYQTNSAYCFAGHGVLSPVKIIQIKRGLRAVQAAEFLLRHYNVPGSRPWWERFPDLMVEQHTRREAVGSSAVIAEALQAALRQHPGYERIQYAQPFVQRMAFRLDQLDRIMVRRAGEDQVRRWYDLAKSDLIQEIDRLSG